MQKLSLSIPEPCHEDWQLMSATEQGRYCSSCKKEVIDFSVMTDKEIVRYLDKTKGNTCGSFLPQQLDRALIVPRQSPFSWKYFFQVLLPVVLFSQKPRAQETIGLMEHPLENTINKSTNDVVILVAGGVRKKQENIVTGIVLDSNTNQPVPFATIQVEGSGAAAFSDSSGVFLIKNIGKSKRVKLIVSSVGYNTTDIVVPVNENKIIRLTATPVKMGEVVILSNTKTLGKINRVTGGVAYSCTKTSFLGRVKDSLLRNNSLSVYPNPVSSGSDLNIQMKGVKKGEYLLQLVINDGKVLQQETIQVPGEKFIFGLRLNDEINPGIYFLRITGPEKKIVRTEKVFIQ